MKPKIFEKYFLITVSIVGLSIIAIMMIFSIVLNNYVTKTAYTTLNDTCEQICQNFENFDDEQSFSIVAKPLATVTQTDIFIVDSGGTVLTCACDDWAEDKQCMHSAYILQKSIMEQVNSSEINQVSTLDMYKLSHYVSAKSIDETQKYFVFVTKPVNESHILISRVSKLYYMWAIIPLAVMLVSIYIVTYKMTKPIKSMSEAAKAVASGDFSKRVPVTSDDEIGELAASFNMMTNSLSRLENTRKNFVANVSHELRTPMTTIGGFIDGILDGTIDPKEHKHYLNIVSSEVKRLTRLVNNMLSVAKLESEEYILKREKFDFFELLFTILIGQEQRIEKQKIEITGLDGIEPVMINCDKDLIYQVIYNLVDNAIKFTNIGGKIDFKLSQDKENLIFAITNTGKGIPEAELPFVFERFYKIDKSRSDVKTSTGLGLYIVNKILSAHKGKILVTSKENEFTTFNIILPKEI